MTGACHLRDPRPVPSICQGCPRCRRSPTWRNSSLPSALVENLRGDDLDPILFCRFSVFPDVDEFDVHPAGVVLFQVLQDRRHHLAGNALVRAEVQQPGQFCVYCCGRDQVCRNLARLHANCRPLVVFQDNRARCGRHHHQNNQDFHGCFHNSYASKVSFSRFSGHGLIFW